MQMCMGIGNTHIWRHHIILGLHNASVQFWILITLDIIVDKGLVLAEGNGILYWHFYHETWKQMHLL